MNVSFNNENDMLRVKLTGEIDHHVAHGLAENIDFKIMRHQPRTIVLDFGAVSFMDSSGLAVVLGRKKTCDTIGSKMHIENLTGYPKKILKLSGIDKFVDIK